MELQPTDPTCNKPYPDVVDRLIRSSHASDLTDAEVVSLLIGNGSSSETSRSQSRELLGAHGNCLSRLAVATPEEMMRVRGIGQRTAVNLLAAIELGRRKLTVQQVERPRICTSAGAYEELKPVLADLPHEEFWVLMLDRGLRLIERHRCSVGGLHGTVADPKCIFKAAIDKRASCILVAHNHPSGQLRPSEEDIRLTRKLVEGGRMLDILVQDHVIVTASGYYSFADNGQMG